jgi:protein ImuB
VPSEAERIAVTIDGALSVQAVTSAAHALAVVPGLSLANARALLPGLTVYAADAAADRRTLERLADWCGRYTPWTAVDAGDDDRGPFGGGAGLWLDIAGCAHLFGDEPALLADLVRRLAVFGFAAVAAVADTAGAAWAVARFGNGAATAIIVPAGETTAALARLPVAALRLPPATVDGLHKAGLRRVGDLTALPRAPLARRFGDRLLLRIDQALGRADEPLSPRQPRPALRVRRALAEPIGRIEDVAGVLRHLLAELCAQMAAAHLGVRRLDCTLYRSDGTTAGLQAGTSRPARDPEHLHRLLRQKLARVDPGFGVEVVVLAAAVVEPLPPLQSELPGGNPCGGGDALAPLVDRLSNWLGPARVVRFALRESHLPERACTEVAALAGSGETQGVSAEPTATHRSREPRPLHLLPWPEPIEVIAPLPDGPPALLRWRRRQHRIIRAEGPERIAPEWWRQDDGPTAFEHLADRSRDYFRLEDAAGQRFWVYREGVYRPDRTPRWYLHGLFS